MKKTLFILLLFASAALAQTPELATVRVYCFHESTRVARDSRVPNGFGSGVYVSENQVITAYHVVEDRKKIPGDPFFDIEETEHPESLQVRFPDGQRRWAAIEAEDAITDVALLRIVPHTSITPLPLGQTVKKGLVVKMRGYGYDFEYRMKRAIVGRRLSPIEATPDETGWCIGCKVDPNGPWVNLLGATALPGDSGGPMTRDGKVVGIVIKMGHGYSQGVHIDHIKALFSGRLK